MSNRYITFCAQPYFGGLIKLSNTKETGSVCIQRLQNKVNDSIWKQAVMKGLFRAIEGLERYDFCIGNTYVCIIEFAAKPTLNILEVEEKSYLAAVKGFKDHLKVQDS